MRDCLRTRLRFLPVVAAVTDEMRGWGVAELVRKVLCEHFGLTDVGKIIRLIAVFIVVNFRRNVAILLANLGIKALGAVPDCVKLTGFKWWIALCSFFKKAPVSSVCITVFFNDDTGKAGHRRVAAAFWDNRILFIAAGQILVKILTVQEFCKIHAAGIELDIGIRCTKEKARCIQSFCIKIRKDGIDQFLHIAVE